MLMSLVLICLILYGLLPIDITFSLSVAEVNMTYMKFLEDNGGINGRILQKINILKLMTKIHAPKTSAIIKI